MCVYTHDMYVPRKNKNFTVFSQPQIRSVKVLKFSASARILPSASASTAPNGMWPVFAASSQERSAELLSLDCVVIVGAEALLGQDRRAYRGLQAVRIHESGFEPFVRKLRGKVLAQFDGRRHAGFIMWPRHGKPGTAPSKQSEDLCKKQESFAEQYVGSGLLSCWTARCQHASRPSGEA